MNVFDLRAKDFDTDARIERSTLFANEFRLHINNGDNKSAMEFGCGTGLVGFQLLNCFNSVLFVDSSRGMIEQVKRKLIILEKSTEIAVCCDLMKDSPNEFNVDYIFSSLVLHHIKDTKTILSRLYTALNKNGHLLIIEINADDGSFHAETPNYDGHNGLDQSILVNLALEVGFREANTNTFLHGNKIVNGIEKTYSFFILDAMK